MKKLFLSNFLIVLFVLIGTVNVVQAQYTVTYDANGATGGSVPSSQTKEHDVPLTLESNTGSLVRTDHFFAGWNTQANGFGTDYAEGASYTANADVTLYAKWLSSSASRWIGTDGLGGGGNWNTAAHWSTGVVPNTTSTDVIIKSGATITITSNVGIRNMTVYGGSEVVFSGNSRLIIRNNITYSGANTKIKLSGSGTGGEGRGNAFLLLGDGTAFTFTGHDASTAFTAVDGKGVLRTGNSTSVTPHVYVDPNVTFFEIGTHRGVSLYKTNVSTRSVTISYANAARLTLDENVTLTITNDISSNLFLGSDINRAAIVADAAGSKVVIKGGALATNMISGNYQVFLSGSTVNALEFVDFAGKTYVPNTNITVKNLIINSGTIDNTTAGKQLSGIDNITVKSGDVVSLGTITAGAMTVEPGAQLSLSAATTATNGITLQSDDTGTATLLNGNLLTGTCTAQQYLAHTRNWYISSPVTGAVAPSGYTYYQRDEAHNSGEGSWTSQPFEAGNTFAVGKGYIALPGTAASNMIFSGTLNSGNQTIALTKGGTGFNLIGNPYPAHLAWTKAFVEALTAPDGGTAPATLIDPTIWIRTNAGTTNNSNQWSFQTYNATTGLAVPGQSLLSGGIIPPMQAFWVKAKEAGNLILTDALTKSHQASNPLRAPALKNTERQLIRLEVSNGTKTDETLLFFDVNAADGIDAYDSPKFAEANTEMQVFTTVGSDKLVMNGMREMPLNREIALGFVPGTASSFTIKASEVENLPSNVRFIVKDHANHGFETDLTDGVTTYQFETTADDTNRFSVLFKAPDVSTDVESVHNQRVSVYVNANSQLVINAPANSNYAVYNAIGQLLNAGITNSDNHTTGFALPSGVYLVKVNKVSKRVIVKQ